MKKILDGIQKICHALLFVFMTILVSVTFWQVFCRFILRIPCSWTEEVARMSFVWLIFVGSALAVRQRSHLSLDMLTGSLKGKAKRISNLFILIAICAIAFVLFIGGADYVRRSAAKSMVTLRIPANLTYISVPLSAFFMMIFAVEQIIMEIQTWRKEGDS